MKILLIHQYYLEKDDPGGSRFNEMTAFWEQKGHEITVIAGMVHYATGKKKNKHKGKFIVKENYSQKIEVIRCHVSEAYNRNFIGRLWAYFSFVFSGIIAGIFKARDKYDIVLVSSPPLFVGITGYVLSRLKRIPLIFEIRDLWPESAIDTGVLKNKFIISLSFKFERFIYKKSKGINTLTPAFYRKLIDEKNVPEGKLKMIPNASDFTLSERVINSINTEKIRSDLSWKNKTVFIYIGAHGLANHLIQIVDAAEKLNESDALFVLIGDGMQKKGLIEEVNKRALNNIQFIDSVPKEKVFEYILAADVGMSVLKRADTFKTIYSNKTFDYMSCKKPVLMLIDGISKELIETAEAGIYAEPENIKDIIQKVNYFIDHRNETVEMGKKGYIFAKENFDRHKLSDKYIEFLQSKLK